jgi:hypothetical protein
MQSVLHGNLLPKKKKGFKQTIEDIPEEFQGARGLNTPVVGGIAGVGALAIVSLILFKFVKSKKCKKTSAATEWLSDLSESSGDEGYYGKIKHAGQKAWTGLSSSSEGSSSESEWSDYLPSKKKIAGAAAAVGLASKSDKSGPLKKVAKLYGAQKLTKAGTSGAKKGAKLYGAKKIFDQFTGSSSEGESSVLGSAAKLYGANKVSKKGAKLYGAKKALDQFTSGSEDESSFLGKAAKLYGGQKVAKAISKPTAKTGAKGIKKAAKNPIKTGIAAVGIKKLKDWTSSDESTDYTSASDSDSWTGKAKKAYQGFTSDSDSSTAINRAHQLKKQWRKSHNIPQRSFLPAQKKSTSAGLVDIVTSVLFGK